VGLGADHATGTVFVGGRSADYPRGELRQRGDAGVTDAGGRRSGSTCRRLEAQILGLLRSVTYYEMSAGHARDAVDSPFPASHGDKDG